MIANFAHSFCRSLPSFSRAIAFVCLSGFLGACTSNPKNKEAPEPPQRVFFSSYESIWRAAQLAIRYPMQVSNMEAGIIETEWIREPDGFRTPGLERKLSMGIRIKLKLFFVKGRLDGRNSVRVTVVKRVEKVPDFFTEPTPLFSDLLEEQVVLYRIDRELALEESIQKLNKKMQQSTVSGAVTAPVVKKQPRSNYKKRPLRSR